jgi:two-component system response regulator AgrA
MDDMLDIYICEDNPKQREFVAGFVSDYCIFRNLDAGVALASGNPNEILSHYKGVLNPALFLLDIYIQCQQVKHHPKTVT